MSLSPKSAADLAETIEKLLRDDWEDDDFAVIGPPEPRPLPLEPAVQLRIPCEEEVE